MTEQYMTVEEFGERIKTVYEEQYIRHNTRWEDRPLLALRKVYAVAMQIYTEVTEIRYFFKVRDVRAKDLTVNIAGIYFSLAVEGHMIFSALIEDLCDLTESRRSGVTLTININDSKTDISKLVLEAMNKEVDIIHFRRMLLPNWKGVGNDR